MIYFGPSILHKPIHPWLPCPSKSRFEPLNWVSDVTNVNWHCSVKSIEINHVQLLVVKYWTLVFVQLGQNVSLK